MLCDSLKTGLGNALVDTGYQVSLGKECSFIKGSDIKRHLLKFHGTMGDYLETKWQIAYRREFTA